MSNQSPPPAETPHEFQFVDISSPLCWCGKGRNNPIHPPERHEFVQDPAGTGRCLFALPCPDGLSTCEVLHRCGQPCSAEIHAVPPNIKPSALGNIEPPAAEMRCWKCSAPATSRCPEGHGGIGCGKSECAEHPHIPCDTGATPQPAAETRCENHCRHTASIWMRGGQCEFVLGRADLAAPAAVSVEACLAELREKFGGHITITVNDCPSLGCRPLAVTIEIQNIGIAKAPTLTEAMARAREWKAQQEKE